MCCYKKCCMCLYVIGCKLMLSVPVLADSQCCNVQSILPALLSQCIIVFCPVQYVCSGFPANYIVPVYHVVPVDYVVQYSLLCLLCCPNALCCMLCCSIVPVDYVVPICLVQSVVSPPLSHCIMLPKIFCCPNVFCCPGVFILHKRMFSNRKLRSL